MTALESRRSGAVGRVVLKLGTRFQGKGEGARDAFFELWGLTFLEAFLEGTMEGLRDGLGDSDLVRPRLEDRDKLRFPILILPPPTLVVSVSSQALLMSKVSVLPFLECFAGDALLPVFFLLRVGSLLVKVEGVGMLLLKGAFLFRGTMCMCQVASLVLFSSAA